MIEVPEEGRPSKSTDGSNLIGIDGNAFSIMGHTQKLLQLAGASDSYIEEYLKEATSGDYDHLLATSIAYLEAEQ